MTQQQDRTDEPKLHAVEQPVVAPPGAIEYMGPDVTYEGLPDIRFPALPKSQSRKGFIARILDAIQENGHDRRVAALEQKALELAYSGQLAEAIDNHVERAVGDGMETSERTVHSYRVDSLAGRVTRDIARHRAEHALPRFARLQENWDAEATNIILGH